jgi:hypothetical protein
MNTESLQRPLVADQDLFRLGLFDQIQHDQHGGRCLKLTGGGKQLRLDRVRAHPELSSRVEQP